MEKVNILPQTIYKFKSSEELLNDTLEKVKNLQWGPNQFNSSSDDKYLNKSQNFIKLHEWFDECITIIKRDLEYDCSEMKITQSWANKTEKGQAHHPHTHPNSILSGIYYLNNVNCPTRFAMSSIWKTFEPFAPLAKSFQLFSTNDPSIVFHPITPEEGTLLIFPSNLEHGVDDNNDGTRYTISFNTFPSGDVGSFGFLTGLRIEVK